MTNLLESGHQPAIESFSTEPSTAQCYQTLNDEVHCWISFGGNVGEVRETFNAALALLSLHCHIRLGERSGLYCSTPMGTQAGSRYLNSVCGLWTRLSPQCLLTVLQSVETQLGRVREIDWGPRTLDLDLLSYGKRVVCEPQLVVPHPALTYRRFVLDPLVEIDPAWCHPIFVESAAQTLDRLKQRPLKVALLKVPAAQVCELSGQLESRFPDLKLVHENDATNNVLRIRAIEAPHACGQMTVDLRRSPGDFLERVTSALTAIFDSPIRVSDWSCGSC